MLSLHIFTENAEDTERRVFGYEVKGGFLIDKLRLTIYYFGAAGVENG